MIETFARQNVAQFVQILRETLPDVTFPDNLSEMMWEKMTEKENERTETVKASILHLKKFPYELPFLPDAIDYKIGEGCCSDIIFAKGLFTPCSKPTKEGDCKCKAHIEQASPFGTFEERLAVWDEGRGIGKLSLLVGEKAYKETTYGEYCKHANITSEIVRIALRRENVCVQIDPRNYEVRTKEKKVRGRPTKHLVEHSESDSEHEPVKTEDIKTEEPVETEKTETEEPVVEKEEKTETKEEPKKEKPKPKPRTKKGTSLDEVKNDSDHEKDPKEKTDEKTEEPKKEPKETKVKKPRAQKKPEGTSLDEPVKELSREDYEGELELLEEVDHHDGNIYYLNDEKVYNAEKKCVGKVVVKNKVAEVVLF
jgi:hypothetical protein